MSETTPAFSHPELVQLAKDQFLFYRLSNLALALVMQRTEAGFTFSKGYGAGMFIYSQLLMPNNEEENNDKDPTNTLHVEPIIAPTGRINPNMGGLVHSHPCEPYEIRYQRYPSVVDMRLFKKRLHPVNPGHIGGIVTVWPDPLYSVNLTLYRASETNFDPEALPNRDRFESREEMDKWPETLTAAGIRFAEISYLVDGSVRWLENLERLYE